MIVEIFQWPDEFMNKHVAILFIFIIKVISKAEAKMCVPQSKES